MRRCEKIAQWEARRGDIFIWGRKPGGENTGVSIERDNMT